MNVDLEELQNWSFATHTNFLSRVRSVCPPAGEYRESITYDLQSMDRHAVFVKMMNFILDDDGNTTLRKQAIVNVFTQVADAAHACQNYISIRTIKEVHDREYTNNKSIVQSVSLINLEAKWTAELEMLYKSIEEFQKFNPLARPTPKR